VSRNWKTPADVVGRGAGNEATVEFVGQTTGSDCAIGIRIGRAVVEVTTSADNHLVGNGNIAELSGPPRVAHAVGSAVLIVMTSAMRTAQRHRSFLTVFIHSRCVAPIDQGFASFAGKTRRTGAADISAIETVLVV